MYYVYTYMYVCVCTYLLAHVNVCECIDDIYDTFAYVSNYLCMSAYVLKNRYDIYSYTHIDYVFL
jgi:hypothetical protein